MVLLVLAIAIRTVHRPRTSDFLHARSRPSFLDPGPRTCIAHEGSGHSAGARPDPGRLRRLGADRGRGGRRRHRLQPPGAAVLAALDRRDRPGPVREARRARQPDRRLRGRRDDRPQRRQRRAADRRGRDLRRRHRVPGRRRHQDRRRRRGQQQGRLLGHRPGLEPRLDRGPGGQGGRLHQPRLRDAGAAGALARALRRRRRQRQDARHGRAHRGADRAQAGRHRRRRDPRAGLLRAGRGGGLEAGLPRLRLRAGVHVDRDHHRPGRAREGPRARREDDRRPRGGHRLRQGTTRSRSRRPGPRRPRSSRPARSRRSRASTRTSTGWSASTARRARDRGREDAPDRPAARRPGDRLGRAGRPGLHPGGAAHHAARGGKAVLLTMEKLSKTYETATGSVEAVQRHLARGRRGRVRLDRRPERLREEHADGDRRRPDRAERGRGPDRRQARDRDRPVDRHRVPAGVGVPVAHGARERRVRHRDDRRRQGRAAPARAGDDRAGRAGGLRGPLPVGALGRHAPARGDRPHARDGARRSSSWTSRSARWTSRRG